MLKFPIFYLKLIQSFYSQSQQSKKPKRKPSATKGAHLEVCLDESDAGELRGGPDSAESSDSEVEEEGEPNEFFDVLDILDGHADPLSDDEPPTVPSRENEVSCDFSDKEEEGVVDDNEGDQDMDPEPEDQLMPSDDEADVDALQNLGQFISALDSSAKRKISEDENAALAENNVPRKKRKLLKERNEAGAESEFAASGEL
jgi:U3 small nucleolar RNA-associated protein 14